MHRKVGFRHTKSATQLALTATISMLWRSWKLRILCVSQEIESLGLSWSPHSFLFPLGQSDVVYWGIKAESVQLHTAEKYDSRYTWLLMAKLMLKELLGFFCFWPQHTSSGTQHTAGGELLLQETSAYLCNGCALYIYTLCILAIFLPCHTWSQTFNQSICQGKTNF